MAESEVNSTINDAPEPPKKYTSLDDNDLFIIEQIEKLSKKINFFYKQFLIVLAISVSVIVISLIVYFSTNKTFLSTIILLVVVVIAIIFFLFSGLLAFVRLIWDRKRLINKLIAKFSSNYIFAYFFTQAKKLEKELCLIKNGNEIYWDNDLYLINYECAWNTNGIPSLMYFKGFPNPINLKFADIVSKWRNATPEERVNLKDTQENPIDLSFDAKALKDFKETDFIGKLLRGKSETMTTILLIVGIVLLALILLIVAYLAIKSGNAPHVIQNTTLINR